MLINVFEKHSCKNTLRVSVRWGSCWLCGLVRRL